ncbi:hypothetical protein BJ138DRAFT_1126015 [Hygrophoropsis aurantiaca]|uniref:Uncharacterized protein n=1 Tax=Hygrophoropsis aurantiaca TaxID=72124 RepID=A0ACB8ADS0_9AGAM|nr:hypothetical protein BJ138DRAFT_1126015 [Hygrophoropsis aurantiaca]
MASDAQAVARLELADLRTALWNAEQTERRLIQSLEEVQKSICNMRINILERTEAFQTSYVDSIPDETLAYIFELAVGEFHELHLPGMSLLKRPEICVSRVSRRWRRVAVNYPALWSKLLLDGSTPLPMLKTYSQRRKLYDLDVKYWLPHSTWTEGYERIAGFFSEYAPYCRELEIHSMFDGALIRENLAAMYAPRLRRLVLAYMALDNISPIIIDRDMPSLHTLELHGVELATHFPVPKFRTVTTLVLLSAVEFGSVALYKMLRHFPFLDTLEISGVVCANSEPPPDDAISLQNLASLTLRITSHAIDVPLRAITSVSMSPKLRCLTLDINANLRFQQSIGMSPAPLEPLACNPQTELLTLYNYARNANIPWLAFVFPNVTTLVVKSNSSSILDELAHSYEERKGVSWPKLKTVIIEDMCHHDTVFGFLRFRKTHGCPITEIKFSRVRGAVYEQRSHSDNCWRHALPQRPYIP